jgi:hypothetical protein
VKRISFNERAGSLETSEDGTGADRERVGQNRGQLLFPEK